MKIILNLYINLKLIYITVLLKIQHFIMFNIIYIPEEKIKNKNSTNINLEDVNIDVLNYKNQMEEHPTIDTNNSVKGNYYYLT